MNALSDVLASPLFRIATGVDADQPCAESAANDLASLAGHISSYDERCGTHLAHLADAIGWFCGRIREGQTDGDSAYGDQQQGDRKSYKCDPGRIVRRSVPLQTGPQSLSSGAFWRDLPSVAERVKRVGRRSTHRRYSSSWGSQLINKPASVEFVTCDAPLLFKDVDREGSEGDKPILVIGETVRVGLSVLRRGLELRCSPKVHLGT